MVPPALANILNQLTGLLTADSSPASGRLPLGAPPCSAGTGLSAFDKLVLCRLLWAQQAAECPGGRESSVLLVFWGPPGRGWEEGRGSLKKMG